MSTKRHRKKIARELPPVGTILQGNFKGHMYIVVCQFGTLRVAPVAVWQCAPTSPIRPPRNRRSRNRLAWCDGGLYDYGRAQAWKAGSTRTRDVRRQAKPAMLQRLLGVHVVRARDMLRLPVGES